MPTVKILKDGKEIVSLFVPDDLEIRIHPSAQPVSELSAPIPPAPSVQHQPPKQSATGKKEEVEVKEIMKTTLTKVEETSKKLMESLDKEKKEDINLIRKVIEQIVE